MNIRYTQQSDAISNEYEITYLVHDDSQKNQKINDCINRNAKILNLLFH